MSPNQGCCALTAKLECTLPALDPNIQTNIQTTRVIYGEVHCDHDHSRSDRPTTAAPELQAVSTSTHCYATVDGAES